jgi:Na+-transporting methylmalonyl-CoA/oxaloacetate decarboxylase beta subunit
MMRAFRIVNIVGTLLAFALTFGATVAFKIANIQSYMLLAMGLLAGVVAVTSGFIFRWHDLRNKSEEEKQVHPFL